MPSISHRTKCLLMSLHNLLWPSREGSVSTMARRESFSLRVLSATLTSSLLQAWDATNRGLPFCTITKTDEETVLENRIKSEAVVFNALWREFVSRNEQEKAAGRTMLTQDQDVLYTRCRELNKRISVALSELNAVGEELERVSVPSSTFNMPGEENSTSRHVDTIHVPDSDEPIDVTLQVAQEFRKMATGNAGMQAFVIPGGSSIDPRICPSNDMIDLAKRSAEQMLKFVGTLEKVTEIRTDQLNRLKRMSNFSLQAKMHRLNRRRNVTKTDEEVELINRLNSESEVHNELWTEFLARNDQEKAAVRVMMTPEQSDLYKFCQELSKRVNVAVYKLAEVNDDIDEASK